MPSSPQRLPFAAPKHRYVIRPEEASELRELYEELPYAAMRAAEALRTGATTLLRGDDLLPFLRAENAVAEIIQRINEILEPEPITLPRGANGENNAANFRGLGYISTIT